jgi:hypothetical protein
MDNIKANIASVAAVAYTVCAHVFQHKIQLLGNKVEMPMACVAIGY